MFDGLVFFHSYFFHDSFYVIPSEKPHKVILKGYIKAGRTRVSLPAGPAPQLVIDSPTLVSFRADNVKASKLNHLIVFLIGLFFVFLVQVVVNFSSFQYFGVTGFSKACCLIQHLFTVTLLSHLLQGQKFGIASQHDVGTPASHVGSNGYLTNPPGLGHYLRFFFMVFCIQHLMWNTSFFEHAAQHLRFLYRYSTYKDGLTLFVALDDLFNNGFKLGILRFVNNIRMILPYHGLVGRYNDNIETIYLLELLLFSGSSPCHACKLVVHSEIVLKGNGCKGLAFPLNLNSFLGFNGLMQPITVSPSEHQSSCKFIDYYYLAILHNVIPVSFHQNMGF